ncbi:UNVERIFIED_CONTAM: hypothetical protein GTU68_038207 [Idotea baltica]|nr:hypothetical protein [Idotea baltica]
MSIKEIVVPDIGDFDAVEVTEILIQEGDEIAVEDSLVTVESDKASMEIPSSDAGKVLKIKVALGDNISEGSVLIMLETAEESVAADDTPPETPTKNVESTSKPATGNNTEAQSTSIKEILIPDIGDFDSVEITEILVAEGDVIQAEDSLITVESDKASMEIPSSESGKVVNIKVAIGDNVSQGSVVLMMEVSSGTSSDSQTTANEPKTDKKPTKDGTKTEVTFDNCIIAAGSRVTKLPFIPWDDPRVVDSTGALELEDVPKRLLVVGGGIIGLEMATVYDALGSEVTIVELSPTLMPGCDRDLVKPLEKRIGKQYENIFTSTKLAAIEPAKDGMKCSFETEDAKMKKIVPESDTFDRVLVSIGRSPNGKMIDADKAGVNVDDHGFIATDNQMRTNVSNIFAIGDIVGQPMLAHKATHEGKTAAEVIAGQKSFFDARAIPSVAYTDPEIAWMGKTEEECKAEGIEYTKGAFPWAASGRSLSNGRSEGMTKVMFDKNTHQIIGAGIVGTNAGELIAEAVLALEMGADAEDIGLTIHPHPTLSETLNFAAEVAEGTCTDIYVPQRKK